MFYVMYINKYSTSNAKTSIVSQWKGEMIQTTIFPPVKVCVGGFNPFKKNMSPIGSWNPKFQGKKHEKYGL